MHTTAEALPERAPNVGDLVQVRSRHWLVEHVTPAPGPGESARVQLACADDDAQGQTLGVFWDCEPDRRILAEEGWAELASQGFDPPRRFAAFLHTLRWHCTTATDPDLFQAPFRAGIAIDAYQMEPLRKALRLPRVNLFIADDTGLGKTIEAGLIARELLLRRKVRVIVVAAPPSVLEQWQRELEDRFGLVFELLDRAYVSRMRRERGFGVNPWHTHSRFLISHRLLIDPTYTDPMRAWLDTVRAGSLLILDEAHHAAPASGGRYGIETKFTRAIRRIAGQFEHRLFLSATPHNGHSNSFSTLLELLDPCRFTRGVPVRPQPDLDDVMVRRLKEDLREIQGGFPKRIVHPEVIDGLPADAPELVLSRLLEEYRTVRDARHREASSQVRAAAGLLGIGLQQRLLSSIEAFARTLAVHRKTVERQWQAAQAAEAAETAAAPGGPAGAVDETQALGAERTAQAEGAAAAARSATPVTTPGCDFLRTPHPDDDDEHDEETDGGIDGVDHEVDAIDADRREADRLDAEELANETAQIEALAAATDAGRPAPRGRRVRTGPAPLPEDERGLLDRMAAIAQVARTRPDAKVRRLLDWIRTHQCPGLPPFGQPAAADPAPAWTARRVLIFTENREGTKRYLREILKQAIAETDLADARIAVIDGLTRGARRREIQRRFNADPAADPLRILIATDAAREGLNFQAHCTDLFHFDLPWNPGRIEQRNGRIDRKLQPASEVTCHYFVLSQRDEDRVLDVLARKTATIRQELGSLSAVIDADVERRLQRDGIRHQAVPRLKRDLARAGLDARRAQTAATELEAARARQNDLQAQIACCRTLLAGSREWLRFEPEPFRDALSCSLEMLGAAPLAEATGADGRATWTFPPLDRRADTDPSWTATLDSLRTPRTRNQKLADWRRDAPIRPVVFTDAGVIEDKTVHLHLEQRVAQRLLARFRAQGFVHHDLSRACLAQTTDSMPRVVLLGRLSLYGHGAERLHEEIVPAAAHWVPPDRRAAPLAPLPRDAEACTLDLLDTTLARPGGAAAPHDVVQRRLLAAAPRDIEQLRPHLETRAAQCASTAIERLRERGTREATALRHTITTQRRRVRKELARHRQTFQQIVLDFGGGERQQLEADLDHWERRLTQFDEEMEREPARIRRFYEVRMRRVEPVGLVYLWPETN